MSNDDWTISHNLSESKQMTMNNQLFRGRVTNVPDNKSNSVRVFISSTFTVTAKEIYQALNNNKNQPQRIVAFFREIEDIDHFDSKLKVKFSDTNDEHGESVLTDLKTFIETELGPNNIFTYRIKWTDESSRMKYLADFKDDFYNAIKNQIDYHMKQTRTKDILYDEVVEHAIQCRMLNERYFPRDNILAQASTWFPKSNSVSIILRFLGTTPLSSDIRQPLISMMKQIYAIYDIEPSSISESTKIEELKKTFEQILTRIPTDETLILLFDSIDQLQIENYDCSKWLPISYPQNIKCILSTIPMISDERKDPPEKYEILDGLKSLLDDAPMIEITVFDEDLAENVFQSWLKRDRRCLTSLQMSWLQPKLQSRTVYTGLFTTELEPTPLFLSLIYDMTFTWHSYDENSDENFLNIKTSNDAIDYLYSQLSKKHNEVFFKRAMAYLQQGGGLSEIELEDMLSAHNEVLQAIFVHYLPPVDIFRIPSTLWIRIRNDMQKYLVEKDVDNTSIIYL
ncbi:unnamed protein product [Rotaria sordida]|uniref:Uncharacterized protein n=1 Tax=Rotaria sordida TaxID=392033 RepID=A0A818UAV3_9BILA|nr:unnamed protein product [Rotaria sordida]CAF3690752.1 unnamed protein product [Rotaria sordida]